MVNMNVRLLLMMANVYYLASGQLDKYRSERDC